MTQTFLKITKMNLNQKKEFEELIPKEFGIKMCQEIKLSTIKKLLLSFHFNWKTKTFLRQLWRIFHCTGWLNQESLAIIKINNKSRNFKFVQQSQSKKKSLNQNSCIIMPVKKVYIFNQTFWIWNLIKVLFNNISSVLSKYYVSNLLLLSHFKCLVY